MYCVNPAAWGLPSAAFSYPLDTLACAGVDLHAMLVRKRLFFIEQVCLVITINFTPSSPPRAVIGTGSVL
jgi:hypothetical protein